jgi:hypothetical protein
LPNFLRRSVRGSYISKTDAIHNCRAGISLELWKNQWRSVEFGPKKDDLSENKNGKN